MIITSKNLIECFELKISTLKKYQEFKIDKSTLAYVTTIALLIRRNAKFWEFIKEQFNLKSDVVMQEVMNASHNDRLEWLLCYFCYNKGMDLHEKEGSKYYTYYIKSINCNQNG